LSTIKDPPWNVISLSTTSCTPSTSVSPSTVRAQEQGFIVDGLDLLNLSPLHFKQQFVCQLVHRRKLILSHERINESIIGFGQCIYDDLHHLRIIHLLSQDGWSHL
jgi:hypothetical protein